MNRTPQRLIGKGELARRVTCNRSYVYGQCKEGGKLANALVGSQVDLNHPDAAHFCASYGYSEPNGAEIAQKARAKASKPRPTAPRAPDPITDDPEPEDVGASELLAMPLGEVVARFGTASHLKDYVAVVKNLVQTRGYDEEQQRKRGEYIHRAHVEQLIVHIDALHQSLLTDATRNMCTRAMTQVAAGEDRQAIENDMRQVISRTIRAVKEETARRLRDV